MIDCNECDYCKVKEQDQTAEKEPHICSKWHKQLYHRANTIPHNKRLYPCGECVTERIIEQIEKFRGNGYDYIIDDIGQVLASHYQAILGS